MAPNRLGPLLSIKCIKIILKNTPRAQTTPDASFGPFFLFVGLRWPSWLLWAFWKNRGKRSPRKNTKSKYLRGQVFEFFVLGIKTRAGTTSDSETMEDK